MKIYETPIINVKKFHAEGIVTSSSDAVKAVNTQIVTAAGNNNVERVDVLKWVY